MRSGEGEVKLMLEYARRMIMSLEAESESYEMIGRIDKNHHLVIEEKEIPLDPGDVTIIVRPKNAEDRKARFERLKALQGSLKDWGVDGVEFQRELRKEWDHR